MRTIPAPELALWTDGDNAVRELRVEVKRPGDASFTNLSATTGGDWVTGVRVQGDTPDQPAGQFTVSFLKHASEGSVSPGLSAEPLNIDAASAFRPILHPGCSIQVSVRIDAEPWRLWLKGQIEDVVWDGDTVDVTCLTLDGVILATQIESEEPSGAPDPGMPVEVEIQNLLDQWMTAPPTLLVVGTPDWGVGEYTPPLGSLGEQLRIHAQRNGWGLRYRWSEADSDFRYTLYLPPRDKTVADFALGLELMHEVAGLKISRQWVRNAVVVHYANSAGVPQTPVEVTDPASITEYGRRAFIIQELSDDSPIKDSTTATALADFAISDLAVPLADGRWRIPFLPWLELHDLIAIQADDDHYDYDTDFAVVGLSHGVDPETGWWTEVELRGGKPAGAFYTWHARPPSLPPSESDFAYRLHNFREVPASAPGRRRWAWDTRGVYVDSIWWAYGTFPAPWTDDNWETVAAQVVPLDDAQDWVEIDEPPADEVGALQVEPRLAGGTITDLFDVVERVQVYPVPPKTEGWIDARYEAGVANVYVGCTPTRSALPVTVQVYEDSQTGTLLASYVFTAAGQISPSTHPALGNRVLSAYGRRVWWAKFTDRAGNVEWTQDALENPQLPRIAKLRQQVGSSSLLTDVFVTVESPVGRPVTLRAWVNKNGTADADAGTSVSGTYVIGFSPGAPQQSTVGPGDGGWSTGSALLADIAVYPGRGKVIHFEAIDDLGFTSGVVDYTLRSWLDIVGADGELIDDAVWRPAQFAASFAPIERVSSLPGSGTRVDERVFRVTDSTLWRWNGSAWVADTPSVGTYSFLPVVIANSITAKEVAAHEITSSHLNVADVYVTGLTVTGLSWSASTVDHQGTTYSVSSGSATGEVVWWDRSSPTAYQAAATMDAAVTAGFNENDGDRIILIRDGGVYRQVWNGTRIYGGHLTTNVVQAKHVSALTIGVGKYIQSDNYVAGTDGWKIDDTSAEFNDGTFRGTVAANAVVAATTLTASTVTLSGTGGLEVDGGHIAMSAGWSMDSDLTSGIMFKQGGSTVAAAVPDGFTTPRFWLGSRELLVGASGTGPGGVGRMVYTA